MAHDPAAVVRRWFDMLWNKRDPSVIDELLTSESVCHSDEGPLRGPDDFRTKQYEPLVTAFPILDVKVEGMLCAGDEVVVRWSATGVHTGDGLGMKATHKAVTFRGMTWIRVKDGKLGEGWQTSNIVEVFRQLGESAGGA